MSRTPSKDEDDGDSASAHNTPSKKPPANDQAGQPEGKSRSNFFAGLDWSDEQSAQTADNGGGVPQVQRSEAQVDCLFFFFFFFLQ
jgi:hypothetical protein